MSNNFLVEPNGPDVMITVNSKSMLIPRGCLAELCGVETIGRFWKKLGESGLSSPDIVAELNDFYRQNNSEVLHEIMDKIKEFCN